MFLMPSRYEPCGLNQIYSLRYGTVPVVRATGGLDDTIDEYNPETQEGTGFKFSAYAGTALLDAVARARAVFAQPAKWKKLMRNGMAKDFSWNRSALEYVKLYEGLAGKRQVTAPLPTMENVESKRENASSKRADFAK